MEYILTGREPADVMRYFEEISVIPRGSQNEKAAAEYVMAFARERGYWCQMDEVFNVVVRKPASPGCENLPVVMLQGHLDMVCEKNQDTDHDFEKDPLKLIVEGDMLRADGTTLGGDNGVAVSYMLAILDRNDIKHPPLECVFTSMEEIGLLGAMQMDGSVLTASKLINLDYMPEDVVVVSSAGGVRLDFAIEADRVPFAGDAVKLEVRGLMGGHSGLDIHLERGNSNKVMGRILHQIAREMDVHIAEISGGSKMNAIPREADALIAVPEGMGVRAVEIAEETAQRVAGELTEADRDFAVRAEEVAAPENMMSTAISERIVNFFYLIPDGAQCMSTEIEGLTVCSHNFAVVTTTEKGVDVLSFIRSSDDSMRDDLAERICTLAKLLRIQYTVGAPMAGWKYEPESQLRSLVCDIYQENTGKEMRIEATHGGIECGIFKEYLPDLDIVAIGPDVYDVHTPEERMDLNSFARTFSLVLELLERLCDA